MVKAFGLDGSGKVHDVLCTFHVNPDLTFGICHQIVNSSKVENVIYLTFQFPSLFGRHTQHGFGQVTRDRNNTFGAITPLLFQSIELLL